MKVLLARTDKLGDMALSIPAFYMIRKMYPSAEITVLASEYNKEIPENIYYINKVMTIDGELFENVKTRIKDMGIDVFIALYSDKQVCKLAKLSKAGMRIGPLSKLESFSTYNYGLRQKRSKSIKHEADYNLDLVRRVDKELFDREYEVKTYLGYPETSKELVESFFIDNNIDASKPVVAINPLDGGSSGNLTLLQYRAIVDIFSSQGYHVVVTCKRSDERRLESFKEIKNCSVFSNKGGLINLAAIYDRSVLFVGGSSGPLHIANAVGTRVFGIYSSYKTRSTTRWGAYNSPDAEYLIFDEEQASKDSKVPSLKVDERYLYNSVERIAKEIHQRHYE